MVQIGAVWSMLVQLVQLVQLVADWCMFHATQCTLGQFGKTWCRLK